MICRALLGAIVPAVADRPACSRAEFAGLRGRCVSCSTSSSSTRALDLIWQRVRRLNHYVEERKPWEIVHDESRIGELEQVLSSLCEGLRAVTVLLTPFIPVSTQQLLDALGAPDHSLAVAVFADTGSGASVNSIPPLFPKLDRPDA